MKKLVFFITLLFATTIIAQDNATDSTLAAIGFADQIASDESQPSAQLLDRHRGTYYLGDQPLTDDEYRTFLINNCPEAWKQYQTGKTMFVSGISVFGAGIYTLSLAGVGAFFGIWFDMFDSHSSITKTCGWIALGGGIAAVVGLPVFIVGNSLKRNAYEVYNESCLQSLPAKHQQQPQLELSLQTSQNGLGLALRF